MFAPFMVFVMVALAIANAVTGNQAVMWGCILVANIWSAASWLNDKRVSGEAEK